MQISNIGLVLTFALTVATLWLGVNRFSMPTESNWPLAYYALLVALANSLPGLLQPEILYVAVVAALMLRFEFMNRRLTNCIRLVEMACFTVIGWRLFSTLLTEFG